jgi:hypothetical protein
MTRAEEVQRYADAIMVIIKEARTPARFPAAFVPGTNSMSASTSATITGWPGCRWAPVRPAFGTLCTMRLAGGWPERKVTHSGQPRGMCRRQWLMAAG